MAWDLICEDSIGIAGSTELVLSTPSSLVFD